MAVSVAAQARALLGALLLGLAAGLLYDLFRVLRVRVHLAFLGPALDLLFWLLCTAVFFFWSADGGGLVRLYTVILSLAGGWFYFSLISPRLLPLYYRLATLFSKLIQLLLLPLARLRQALEKFSLICKNHFHYWKEWFTINKMFKKMAVFPTSSPHHSRGGFGSEIQNGPASSPKSSC